MYGASTWLGFTGEEPLTLIEAKNHLRVDFDTDDTTISALISAARGHCENYIGFTLRKQQRKTLFECFGDFKVYGPVLSIESIEYKNTDGTSTTVTATEYDFEDGKVGRIYPVADWPTDLGRGSVAVTYTAGYEPENVPQSIKQAMLLILGDWYENPADSTRRFPTASKAILDMFRVTIL